MAAQILNGIATLVAMIIAAGVTLVLAQSIDWCWRKLTGRVCHVCGNPWFMDDGFGGLDYCTKCGTDKNPWLQPRMRRIRRGITFSYGPNMAVIQGIEAGAAYYIKVNGSWQVAMAIQIGATIGFHTFNGLLKLDDPMLVVLGRVAPPDPAMLRRPLHEPGAVKPTAV